MTLASGVAGHRQSPADSLAPHPQAAVVARYRLPGTPRLPRGNYNPLYRTRRGHAAPDTARTRRETAGALPARPARSGGSARHPCRRAPLRRSPSSTSCRSVACTVAASSTKRRMSAGATSGPSPSPKSQNMICKISSRRWSASSGSAARSAVSHQPLDVRERRGHGRPDRGVNSVVSSSTSAGSQPTMKTSAGSEPSAFATASARDGTARCRSTSPVAIRRTRPARRTPCRAHRLAASRRR